MNILLSFQSFHCEYLFNEIVDLSNRTDIDKIFIVSSLMNDLDEEVIRKYENIQKTEIIPSNTLFSLNNLCGSQYTLSKVFIENNINIYSNILSSYRWLPINERAKNDYSSFAMVQYYDVHNFWNNFFAQNNIDSVILLNDEHSSQDNILISSAKINNIKNIITTSITGAFAAEGKEFFSFYDSVNGCYLNLSEFKNNNKAKNELSENSNFETFSEEYKTSLKDKIKNQFDKVINILNSNTNAYVKINTIFKKLYSKIKTNILLTYQLYYIRKLKKYYENISFDNIDYDNKFIYYCLHFDPEATTLPKDNSYSNQLLNIRIVSSALPNGWVLYVKEHPHQLKDTLYKNIFLNQLHSIDNFRSEHFYKYINSLTNVKLVSLQADHKLLIQNAQFIASNTGTVFREATYLNKKCISFSQKSLYTLLDNVTAVSDLESCEKAINCSKKIINNDVDELYNNYSITISKLYRRDAELLFFINNSNIFRIYCD